MNIIASLPIAKGLHTLLILLGASIAGGLVGVMIGKASQLGKNMTELQSIGTFGLVMVAAAIFGQLGMRAPTEAHQLLAGIATGSGFLSGAVIYRTNTLVEGTTTASFIWAASAIGLAYGMEELDLAIVGTLFMLILTWFHEHNYPDLRMISHYSLSRKKTTPTISAKD